MSEKINVVETRGNGYVCQCCSRTWEDEDWIEASEMMPFEELYERAVMVDPSNQYELTDLQYYDEFGNGIYGYSSSYGRSYLNVYLRIGEKDYLVRKNDTILLTKEEMETYYAQFLIKKGEDNL